MTSSVQFGLPVQLAKMSVMHRVLFLCFVALSQSSFIPEEQHFLTSIIDKVNSAGTTWKAGHNFHPSISKATLKRLCGVVHENDDYDGPYKSAKSFGISDLIPATFDARYQWPKCRSIGHVNDQGNCGSCWAVAITSSLTDRFCIASDGKYKHTLSTEDLLTCCNECGHGCDGGSPTYVWKHLTRHGIVTGGDHGSYQGCKPYSLQPCEHHVNGSLPKCGDLPESLTPQCHFRCSNPKFGNSYYKDYHKVKSYYRLNETMAIQKEILANGPVEAQFDVYEDFVSYKSGVYQHVTGKMVGGHAVKVIGWGEENDTPYWLAVNSWNKHWGQEGLFKIRRGNNECKFEGKVFAGTPDLANRFARNDEMESI